MDIQAHSVSSSGREKILEHLFVGDLLRCLWRKGIKDAEVLRAEVDSGGYDLVIECRGVLRHVQLKASHNRARTARVPVNTRLSRKPSGCVVWMQFNAETLDLGPFLWLGGRPGEALPELGDRIARHTRADSLGEKHLRRGVRVVPKSRFSSFDSIDDIAMALFGDLNNFGPAKSS